MGERIMKYYVAYGSNLNLAQMAMRCPNARVVDTGYIRGRELVFSGVATIVPKRGCCVPVLVWAITPKDEAALDRYEGYPHMYRKENVNVWLSNGKKQECMVYVMNRWGISPPSRQYYSCIERGYLDNGIPLPPLEAALARSSQR